MLGAAHHPGWIKEFKPMRIFDIKHPDKGAPQAPSESLTAAASKNVFWNMVSSFGVSGIRFTGTAVLARILFPEDFGIIAMAYLITEVIFIFGNLGMGAALIHRQDVDDEYLNTSFWSSLAIGMILTLSAYLSSPLAGIFFKHAVVVSVIQCLSVNFFISSVVSVQTVLLTKNLQFKELAIVEITTTVFRVAVILTFAFLGFRFWSIVVGSIVERVLKTTIFYIRSAWRPAFQFSVKKYMILFNYGKHLYGGSFLAYFNRNMDFIITGRVFGAADLGYYQFAFNIPHLVLSNFTQKVGQVLFPVYSKVQDDKERVRRGVLKTTELISILTFPLMFGLMFTARDFILTVYGNKWLPSVLPLQILCLSGAVKSVNSVTGILFMSQGRPDISFKWGLFILPLTIGVIYYCSRWSIVGVAIGMVVLTFLGFVAVKIALDLIDTKMSRFFRHMIPGILGSLGMVLILYLLNRVGFVRDMVCWQRLFLNIFFGVLIYAGLVRVFFNDSRALLFQVIKGLCGDKK